MEVTASTPAPKALLTQFPIASMFPHHLNLNPNPLTLPYQYKDRQFIIIQLAIESFGWGDLLLLR